MSESSEPLSSATFSIAGGVWSGVGAVLLASSALWWLGVPSPVGALCFGGLVSCLVTCALLRRASALGLIGPLLVAISCLVAGLLYDFSFDGQYYHQFGILQLARGWNPLPRSATGSG